MRLFSIILACSLVSCGMPQSHSLTAADPLPGSVVDDELAGKLSGTYAVLLNITTNQQLPIVGKITTTAQILRLSQVSKAGQGLVIKDHACHAAFDSSNPALSISVSDASIRSLPTSVAPLRVWKDQGVLNFAQDPQVLVAGANLADRINDALPTKVNDPRLVDVDRDGKPGLTSTVSATLIRGEIYAVQRSISSYAGTQAPNGHLVGLVKDKTEQVVIDASNFLLKIGAAPSVADPDRSKSNIRMVKLAADANCDDVDFESIFSGN